MGRPVRIVPMKATDVDEVVAIERRSFASGWKRVHFLHEIRKNPWAFNRVLAQEGHVLGYACLWCLQAELKINNLAIHPDFRRRGLASRLLGSVLREGRRLGCSRATLEVRPSNLAARRLYRIHGFVEVGRRENYYALEGEDAILMNLDLSTLPKNGPEAIA
jgi:ribosomal-protein-alanine N-acetyltransferase